MALHDASNFDVSFAHRHFSADCFNRAWELMAMPARTPADDEAMELAAAASLWHWTQRPDCTGRHLSIGHWQLARVYALLGRGGDSMRHARRCLTHSEGLPPFYVGYAHEAVARAALASGEAARCREHLERARRCAGSVTEDDERELLERDVRELEGAVAPPS
jgi:hypothetical protein